MGMTFFIAFLAFLVSWGLAIPSVSMWRSNNIRLLTSLPLSALSAGHARFLLALVLMYISYAVLGLKVGGCIHRNSSRSR